MTSTTTKETAPPAGTPWPALLQSRKMTRLHKKIVRTMMTTIERWQLVQPGDHVMVAISGGKDSYALVDLLWDAKQRAPFRFDVTAVHLDQVQPGYDGAPLVQWLQQRGVPFEILREDTYTVVKDGTKEGQAYCFLCARLRRGILYAAAERLGCNKVALGHHRDDGLETMLLNLCYAGKLQAMPARYTTDDGRFVVVRPLIDTGEDELRAFAVERAYPILPCNLCGSQEGLKRDAMAELLVSLEQKIPDVRRVMHHAIQNIRPTHMLDQDVLAAWQARPADIEARQPSTTATPRRMTGTVVKSGGMLPILNDEA
jgi:tRNA 2-thiocytidine biosynthesis protein TtcA